MVLWLMAMVCLLVLVVLVWIYEYTRWIRHPWLAAMCHCRGLAADSCWMQQPRRPLPL